MRLARNAPGAALEERHIKSVAREESRRRHTIKRPRFGERNPHIPPIPPIPRVRLAGIHLPAVRTRAAGEPVLSVNKPEEPVHLRRQAIHKRGPPKLARVDVGGGVILPLGEASM